MSNVPCVENISPKKTADGRFIMYHTKQKKGNTVYVYYMIAWYCRIDKKPVRKTIKHLGKLTPEEITFYKNGIACLNKEPGFIACRKKNIVVTQSKEYLSCAVGVHFWDHWQLSSVFTIDHETKKVGTSDIAKVLTVMRNVMACSKSLTAKLYEETCLPELVNVAPGIYNKSRIFRELEQIEKQSEKLGKHIFDIAKSKKYTQGDLLFYDLSTKNISGLKCVMAKWGHCKSGYDTHVVLMLVITPEGYPVYWDVLEGNTADSSTIENLISKVQRIYGTIDSVLCFDRGMVSDANLKLLEAEEIQFITALDGNQVNHFKELIDFSIIKQVKCLDHKEQINEVRKELINAGYLEEENNLFYKELELSNVTKKAIGKLTDKLNLEKRRYFLAFNPELAFLTQKHRKNRVCEFIEWIKGYNKALSLAVGNRKKETVEKAIKKELKSRNILSVKIKYTISEYKVQNNNNEGRIKNVKTFKINLDKITENSYKDAKQYDGLWVLITNLSEGNDIEFFSKSQFKSFFEIYRLKNNIEEAFRILSDFVEIAPFYVYKTEHIKAHFTICVLSYLLGITILNKIRESDKIENMDLHTLFRILRKCKQDIIRLNSETTITTITSPTVTQKTILGILGCSYLTSPEHLLKTQIVTS